MEFTKYTALTAEQALKKLAGNKKGLSAPEAQVRLKKFGFNQIASHELKWWHIFFKQFNSPFIYILFFASGLALTMGEKIDGFMILGFITINVIISFIQEYHSAKTIQLLRKFIIARCHVWRSGSECLLDSRELVPGDIAVVETGDIIPADLRFIETNALTVNESILTGESAPVWKTKEPTKQPMADIAAAKNIGFVGTMVVSGRALGVVIATGNATIMGEIAVLTASAERTSPFAKGIYDFSRFIMKMTITILILLFTINLLIKGANANLIELTLFSIALAVSVIPEALPLVTTLSLSTGAMRLARRHVVVKRLTAVEDLGSIEILCADKTGTITENKLAVAQINSPEPEKCLLMATITASFLTEKKADPNNAFDLALWQKLTAATKAEARAYTRVNEIPFDPDRRKNSVLVKISGQLQLIVRGAPEAILAGTNLRLSEKKEALNWSAQEGLLGRRVIAVANKAFSSTNYKIKDEHNLIFLGMISFFDPLKTTSQKAINKAEHLGVQIKILTGDGPEVAGAVAKQVGLIANAGQVLTGKQLDAMDETERLPAVESHNVFARISPTQKYEIIQILQKKYAVGFLGEGINDAPALKIANVAIAVNKAADIAREASDIILLRHDLKVIIDGVQSGREIFCNTIKYLEITLISNFGNFYAIAIASLVLLFLPMLPVQILLLNLLSDFPMIAIVADSVDRQELKRPRIYNVHEVAAIAILFGFISTVFDFIIFALFYHAEPSVLQTNWFIGSVLTELALIFSMRTKLPFWRSRPPSLILGGLTAAAALAAIIIPFTIFGQTVFKFIKPSSGHLLIIAGVVLGYFIITETIKKFYFPPKTQLKNL